MPHCRLCLNNIYVIYVRANSSIYSHLYCNTRGLGNLDWFFSFISPPLVYLRLRIILSETYEVEDCHYYNPNTWTNDTNVNILLPNSDYELSWKGIRVRQGSMSAINSGSRTIGLASTSPSPHGIYGTGGATINTAFPSGETLLTLKYENGTYTYSVNGESASTSSVTDFDNITLIIARQSGYVKELKIKPL